jgi:hypothetical protein
VIFVVVLVNIVFCSLCVHADEFWSLRDGRQVIRKGLTIEWNCSLHTTQNESFQMIKSIINIAAYADVSWTQINSRHQRTQSQPFNTVSKGDSRKSIARFTKPWYLTESTWHCTLPPPDLIPSSPIGLHFSEFNWSECDGHQRGGRFLEEWRGIRIILSLRTR